LAVKVRITICPPPPKFLLNRRAALSTISKGALSVYEVTGRAEKQSIIMRCLCVVQASGVLFKFCFI
jgi:hypothetical protein